MHIPGHMLSGAVSASTLGISSIGISLTALMAKKREKKPSLSKFIAVSSFIFAVQMLNYPVSIGTSGHILAAVLASVLLGVPFGVLAVSIVLSVQTIFFGDGSLSSLGANVLNMALIGAGAGGYIFALAKKTVSSTFIAAALGSFVSVLLAAFACGIELSLSGITTFGQVLPAMISAHFVIGLIEAVITGTIAVASMKYFEALGHNHNLSSFAVFGLALICAFLSPLASVYPDGLESVARMFSFPSFSVSDSAALFNDYSVAGIDNPYIATVLAALVGIILVSFATGVVNKALRLNAS